MITPADSKIKLYGICEAAAAAGVSRQHVYLCCRGERKPSARLAAIIEQMVKPRPAPGKAAPGARQGRASSTALPHRFHPSTT